MTIKVFQEDSENPTQKVVDDSIKLKTEKSIEFGNDTNFKEYSKQYSDHRPSVAFSENYFKVPSDRRQSLALSEKTFQDNFSITKLQSDHVLYSSGNYIAKYYKPSANCNNNNNLLNLYKMK
jgi:hypothetical protein